MIADTLEIHNNVIIDEYSWIKDTSRSNREVIQLIEAENKYTRKMTAHLLPIQNQLFKEIKNRENINDQTIPVKVDSFLYYTRILEDKQYYQYCRKQIGDDKEEVYLNLNQLAENKSFFTVYNLKISPNHKLCAYSYDDTGDEFNTIVIKDLDSGKYLNERIENADEICWMNDGKRLLYLSEDVSGRSFRLFCHHIGTDPRTDQMLYEEKDEAFYLWLRKSKSKAYIFLGSFSKTTSEYYHFSAEADTINLNLFQERETGHQYYPYHNEDRFIIKTNLSDAFNYKVMTCDFNNTGKKNWKPYIPHNDSVFISIDVFRDFMVLKESANGTESFRLNDFEDNTFQKIKFPGEIYSLSFSDNPNYITSKFRLEYESFHIPETTYEFNLQTNELKTLKKKKIGGDFDQSQYVSIRIFVPNKDLKIPLTLVYNSSLVDIESPNKILMEGYGAYGDKFEPYFSKSKLSLYDRGVVYAIAHVRGGGFYGTRWHDLGKTLSKKSTFEDFITCTEYLINNGYTTPEKLVIEGGSAGGLLIGAVLNQKPELFKAAIADVPFVDIIHTMLDKSLSAVVSEYEEWGNPNLKEEFAYMLSYSPYENIRETAYPVILVITGFHDIRVNYWEPVKWISRLRRNATDNNLKLIYIDMESGHSGASGRFDYYREVAFKYAFVLDQLNLN